VDITDKSDHALQHDICRIINIGLARTVCLSVIIFVTVIAFVPRTITLVAKVRAHNDDL
jgi:hypothetical protein